MDNIFDHVLNKSVPVSTPVMLNLMDILDIFSDNEKLRKNIRKEIITLISYVSNIIDAHAGDIFSSSLVTISSDDDKTKKLVFSEENYFITFIQLLGIDTDDVFHLIEDKELREELIRDLQNIKKVSYLRGKYPNLYHFYLTEEKVCKDLLEIDRIMNHPNIDIRYKLGVRRDIVDKNQELYPNYNIDKHIEYAKNFSIELFMKKYIHIIEQLIDHAEDIIHFIQNSRVSIHSLSEKNSEKLQLYVTSCFLDELERVDINDKQRYLYYVTTYFKENPDRITSKEKIKLGRGTITAKSLYERYRKVLVLHPELMTIHFKEDEFENMTMQEVEEYMVEYLKDLSANWDILPPNSDQLEKDVIKSIKSKTSKIIEKERKEKEQRLLDLYMEKKMFYDSTDPFYRVKGKNTFDGYVGYIYSNGLVILDKFYDNISLGKVADGEAIYVMNIKEFSVLSRHSKLYLIKNQLCRRVIHKGDWQKRVLKIIHHHEKTDVALEMKKLIKTNQVTRNSN